MCVQLSHLIFSPFPLFPCDCSPSFLSTTNLCASPSPSPCPALFFFVCLCLLCSIGREGRIKESKIAIPLSSFLFRFLFLWTMLTFHFCPSFSSLSFVSSPLPSPLFSSFFSLSSSLLLSTCSWADCRTMQPTLHMSHVLLWGEGEWMSEYVQSHNNNPLPPHSFSLHVCCTPATDSNMHAHSALYA